MSIRFHVPVALMLPDAVEISVAALADDARAKPSNRATRNFTAQFTRNEISGSESDSDISPDPEFRVWVDHVPIVMPDFV